MKKVRFLKDHVNGIKKGQVGDFNEGRANYLIRVGVAELVGESVKAEPKKTAAKPKAKTKAKAAKAEPCKTC